MQDTYNSVIAERLRYESDESLKDQGAGRAGRSLAASGRCPRPSPPRWPPAQA